MTAITEIDVGRGGAERDENIKSARCFLQTAWYALDWNERATMTRNSDAENREIEPCKIMLFETGNHARMRTGIMRNINSKVSNNKRLSALS